MSKVQTSLRLDEDKLREAKKILGELGMNFTEAVNVFTNMIVAKRGLPFEVQLPNKETESVLKEIRADRNSEEVTLDDLKAELDDAETA